MRVGLNWDVQLKISGSEYEQESCSSTTMPCPALLRLGHALSFFSSVIFSPQDIMMTKPCLRIGTLSQLLFTSEEGQHDDFWGLKQLLASRCGRIIRYPDLKSVLHFLESVVVFLMLSMLPCYKSQMMGCSNLFTSHLAGWILLHPEPIPSLPSPFFPLLIPFFYSSLLSSFFTPSLPSFFPFSFKDMLL